MLMRTEAAPARADQVNVRRTLSAGCSYRRYVAQIRALCDKMVSPRETWICLRKTR